MNTQAATLARQTESLDMPMLAIALPLLLVSLVLAGSGAGALSLALSGLGAIAAYTLARQALLASDQAKTVTV
ncbi:MULTISPECIES: hypothetical protein [Pseudomonadaceae]|uniref:Uncharacterized protein n=1 Tax=Pseudomonas straminea TaxID=47882 RepID=A0A1I1VXS3_PSEOC|nr:MULTISPECIES: hypothetical protein [Pseudomonas]MDD1507736.1 hypothetical protein [Pseudomonas sp. CNPSo 3701]TWE00815.1 hypothetical protein FB481_11339 [Pseudomonas sp. AG1028]GLX14406.1 hypothetical protein Pstr01_26450 [Pseudomonas straminea]SFD87569.1 hypothetical protein SAMN05216372_10539 [Pseudomonas straminea]